MNAEVENQHIEHSDAAESVDSTSIDTATHTEETMGQPDGDSSQYGELPRYAKERLGKQKKKHEREMREMREKVERLENQHSVQQPVQPPFQPVQDGSTDNANTLWDEASGTYIDSQSTRGQVMLELQRQNQFQQVQHQRSQQESTQSYLKNRSNDFMDEVGLLFDEQPELKENLRPEHLTDTMLETMSMTENRCDLFAYLSKNPKEVERISRLPAIEQVGAIMKHGYNAARVSVSNAPPPVTPVKGQGTPNNAGRALHNLNYRDMRSNMHEKERKHYGK